MALHNGLMYKVLQVSLQLHKAEQGSLGLKEVMNERNNSKIEMEMSQLHGRMYQEKNKLQQNLIS